MLQSISDHKGLWSDVTSICSAFSVVAVCGPVMNAKSNTFPWFCVGLPTSEVSVKLCCSSHTTKASDCLEGEECSRSQLGWCKLKSPARKVDCQVLCGRDRRVSTASPAPCAPTGALYTFTICSGAVFRACSCKNTISCVAWGHS